MIHVRPAVETDVPDIRDIFLAVYGQDYPYKDFYDEQWLKRSLFNDHNLMLVAEDSDAQKILGTASVHFEFGAHSDLVGEFGRLAVNPDSRKLGVGQLLMEARIDAIRDRLHLGLVMARVVHPYAQKISLDHDFVPLGFLPLCYCFSYRESFALMGRHFGDALALRKNNPRIIPEAYPIANISLPHCTLPCDCIVDEASAPYPYDDGFQLKELTVQGYPALLRIERGRVRNREIFGNMRLEYGFFKLQSNHATYFLASDDKKLVGAIGFTRDDQEHSVRVFELISFTEQAIRFLLSELERKCREEWKIQYIEIDVSAHSPRMQRTLLELNFLPVAYIPAMVFHEVERLDIIRMVRLNHLQDLGPLSLTPHMQEMADVVMNGFYACSITPKIARVVADLPLFQGMTQEQINRVAGACTVQEFEPGSQVFSQSEISDRMYVLLEGRIGIEVGTPPVQVGIVERGETLGELSLLTSRAHSATANTKTRVEAAVLTHQDLSTLVRRRPDIGVIIFRNLGVGLGKKLLRSDDFLREQTLAESSVQP